MSGRRGKVPRQRLDLLLTEHGLCSSREKARRAIMAGLVQVDGQVVDKPGTRVSKEAAVVLAAQASQYVSRGGDKLEGAWRCLRFPIVGVRAADVGASTGGFTDFLLQHGAARVHAVDVGYGQLAWPLRQDSRVVALERVNARHLSARHIAEPVDLAVIDVAFIGLAKVLPAVVPLLGPRATLVALVKPQFEAGPGRIGEGGVVREPETHQDVLEDVLSVVEEVGLFTKGLCPSPLRGPAGNIEFFIRADCTGPSIPVDVPAVVARAHE